MFTDGMNTSATNNEQLMMLLKLQGSAAQVLAHHVNDSANKRKKMEEANLAHHIDECRRREDIMMLLNKHTSGSDDEEGDLYIKLSKRVIPKSKGALHEFEENGEDTAVNRSSTGSLIKEIGPVPSPNWTEFNRISIKRIATLLLANNNPMFSLCSEINPYPDQCLKEVLPGASMVVVPTFELLCQMADSLLTETLTQICLVKLENGENVYSNPINTNDVRAALRFMDKGFL